MTNVVLQGTRSRSLRVEGGTMAIERGVFTDKLKFGFGIVYYRLNPAMMSSYGYHRTRCRQDCVMYWNTTICRVTFFILLPLFAWHTPRRTTPRSSHPQDKSESEVVVGKHCSKRTRLDNNADLSRPSIIWTSAAFVRAHLLRLHSTFYRHWKYD